MAKKRDKKKYQWEAFVIRDSDGDASFFYRLRVPRGWLVSGPGGGTNFVRDDDGEWDLDMYDLVKEGDYDY